MTGRRRLQILSELAAAEHGLTMFDRINQRHRFYAHEIAALDGLVSRKPGGDGVYRITEQGRSYLAVMQPVGAGNGSVEKVAA